MIWLMMLLPIIKLYIYYSASFSHESLVISPKARRSEEEQHRRF